MGWCSKDLSVRCKGTPECESEDIGVCVFEVGHCVEESKRPCLVHSQCNLEDRCSTGKPSGDGVCACEQIACSSDEDCLSYAKMGGPDGKTPLPCPCEFPHVKDKTCVGDRSIRCATDADCPDGTAPCDDEPGGLTCALNIMRRCTLDEHCLPDDGPCQGPSYTPTKTCAGDRSIKCSIDADCPKGTAPCDDGYTCSKDRSIKCFTDAECADKAPCDSGKTCEKDRSIKCKTDAECDDKAPCDDGSGGGDKTCEGDRTIPCDTDADCPKGKDPCNTEDDEECCACFPDNPDLRWPGVKGSPIVTDMGNPEYQWGKRGDKNPNNPVGRMNQPRPPCCPCGPKKLPGTCAGDTSITCASDKMCKKGLKDFRPCVFPNEDDDGSGGSGGRESGRGGTGKSCANDRSTRCTSDADCDPPSKGSCSSGKSCALDRSMNCFEDAECGSKKPCNSGKACAKDSNLECVADADCGAAGPCSSGKTCALDRSQECVADIECAEKAPCNTGKICAKRVEQSCAEDVECDDRGPCVLATSLERGYCAKNETKLCRDDAECTNDRGPCVKNARRVCLQNVTRRCTVDADCDSEGPCVNAGFCALSNNTLCLVDSDCPPEKEPCVGSNSTGRFVIALRHAIAAARVASRNNDHVDRSERLAAAAVVEKHDLLSRYRNESTPSGPAAQACRLLGREKCRKELGDALSDRDIAVVTSMRVLRAGEATAACLGFGSIKCRLSLEEARRSNHTGVVEAILRLQAAANASKESAKKETESHVDALRKIAAELHRLGDIRSGGVSESKPITHIEKDDGGDDDAAESASDDIASGVQVSRVEAAVRAYDGPYGAATTTEPDPLAVCNAPGQQTSHCYCEVLGPRRCRESLFAAYLSKDVHVLASIRALLGGNVSSTAVDLCRALGPHRCRETVAEAVHRGDLGVVAAWRFLVNGTLPNPADLSGGVKSLNMTTAPVLRACKTSDDCANATMLCVESVCREARTVTLYDCGNGERCNRDVCLLWKPGTQCEITPRDCGNGQACLKSACTERPFNGRCSLPKEPCGLGQSCRRAQCRSDASRLAQCPLRPSGTFGSLNVQCESTRPGARCTYSCRFGLEINGASSSTCQRNATWSSDPPSCAIPFSCAPDVSFESEKACLEVGYCSCMNAVDPNTLQPPADPNLNSTSEGCETLVEEATNKACEWRPKNVWIPGKGKMALFYAIKRADRKGVKAVLAYGEDPNSFQGEEGCVPGPGSPDYGKIEPSRDALDSPWCMAAKLKRPLDVAMQSSDSVITRMLQTAGALPAKKPGAPSVGYPYRWAQLMESYNRTTFENGSGVHGYIYEMLPQGIYGGLVEGNNSGYQPWWNCEKVVDKNNGASGCYPHSWDYGDNEDLECDPDTGVGCECEDALPPDSDFVCEPTEDPDTGDMVKIKRHKDSRARKFGVRNVVSNFNPKRGQFSVKKPGDCDWNPFTNPPYFLFCIILKILKPLFSPFLFLEAGESVAALPAPPATEVLANLDFTRRGCGPCVEAVVASGGCDALLSDGLSHVLMMSHPRECGGPSFSISKCAGALRGACEFGRTQPRLVLDAGRGDVAILADARRYESPGDVIRNADGGVSFSFLEINRKIHATPVTSLPRRKSSLPMTTAPSVLSDPVGAAAYMSALRSLREKVMRGVKDGPRQIDELVRLGDVATNDYASVLRRENEGHGDIGQEEFSTSSMTTLPNDDTRMRLKEVMRLSVDVQRRMRLRGGVVKKPRDPKRPTHRLPRPLPRYGAWEWWPGDGPGGSSAGKKMDDKTKSLFSKLDKIVGDGKKPIDHKAVMDLVEEEAGEAVPDSLRPQLPGYEKPADDGATAYAPSPQSDNPKAQPRVSSGDELYGPTAMHESAAVPFDNGRGVLIFGGVKYDFKVSKNGDAAYNNDAWYLRVGWDIEIDQMRRAGFMWLPAVLAGTPPSPRAGHSGTLVKNFKNDKKVEVALFFGGYDGVDFFDDLWGLWPVKASDTEVLEEQRKVMKEIALANGVKAPKLRMGTGAFWATFVNPFPTGWISEPQPEIREDLDARRNQTFDNNWWLEQGDVTRCTEKFTSVDENGTKTLKPGANEFCAGKVALPWAHDPWIRGSRDEHKGQPWKSPPRWRKLSPGGRKYAPSRRYRHAASVVGPYYVVFGGYGPDLKSSRHPQIFFDDLHVMDVRTMSWIGVDAKGTPPVSRAGHAATVAGTNMFFFGGYSGAAGLHNDVHILQLPCAPPKPDPNEKPPSMAAADEPPKPAKPLECAPPAARVTAKWRKTILQGPSPIPRFGHSMVPAMEGTMVMVIGGFGAGSDDLNWRRRKSLAGYRNDLFLLDPMIPNITSVSPRHGPALGGHVVYEIVPRRGGQSDVSEESENITEAKTKSPSLEDLASDAESALSAAGVDVEADVAAGFLG
eukprot:g2233.t1